MDHLSIIKDIKAKKTKPIYILYGTEPFFIDEIIHEFEHKFTDPAHVGFDQTILYGKDANIIQIISTANRYPLLAPQNVVIVKEAQDLGDIEALLSYASKANQQAILVMGFKYEEEKKSQTKILNQLKENAIIFKSEPVRDYHLNKWLTEYCSSQNISIEPKAIDLLAEHIGSNLQLLINEISKIRLNLSPSQSITQALVEQSVKANKEYSGFEFQDAFGERNNAKALRIANYFRNNEKDHHILKYLGPLFSYFQKVLLVKQHQKNPQAGSLAKMLEVNEYFVKKYVAAASRYNELQLIIILKLIYQYDLKAKGVENAQTDSGDLIVELTSKILLA